MQYNSVTDYFSRLQTRSLIVLFISVLMFLALFYLLMMENLTPVKVDENGFIGYAFVVFAIMDASMSVVLTRLMLRGVKPLQSLGERLDRYAQANMVRFVMLFSGSVLLTVALYLNGDERIALAYFFYLLFFLFAWPTRSRLCEELQLKENEREVIYGR